MNKFMLFFIRKKKLDFHKMIDIKRINRIKNEERNCRKVTSL